MNLHIVPDNTFINKFYENLLEAGLGGRNKIVVRSNAKVLTSIKYNLPVARLYTSAFSRLVGDTSSYEKVYIHYFSPLMYRWIATHKFRELSWMVWGGDLYNLPSLDDSCYEPITLNRFIKRNKSLQSSLYELKVLFTQSPFRNSAYAKVRNVLTWMQAEYSFAITHLPLRATHQFFFYENQMPYHELDAVTVPPRRATKLTLIVGNSGSPTNNHLDAVQSLNDQRVDANLLLPVSYGDKHYISFLKSNLKFDYGDVEFVDRYIPFNEYVKWLASADGLVMNSLRPQGYGNILMMMYLGKPVFLNKKNISLADLEGAGLKWYSIENLKGIPVDQLTRNKEAVKKFLSHDRLLTRYQELF